MPNYTPIGTDLEAEELSALRKQRVAEMLMGQSMQPVQPFSKAGAYVTPMHWSQGLAQIAQALVAAKKGKSADAELKGIGDKRKQVADAAMSRFQAKSQGLPVGIKVDRLEGGSDVMGQKYMADPEGAAVELAGNAAVPQASRDAGVLQYQAGVRREEKGDERDFRDAQARAAAAERSESQRLADEREARMRGDLASANNAAQIQAAQIAADARRDVAASSGQKEPAHMRYNADGELEPIPGGKEDVKRNEQIKKENDARDTALSTIDAELRNIDQMIGRTADERFPGDKKEALPQHAGLTSSIGSFDQYTPTFLPEASDFEALLDSLKSKTSINALRDIKMSGANAIGAITEAEWPRMENMKNTLGLGQKDSEFPKRLAEYRDGLLATRARIANADVGAVTPNGPAAPAATGGASAADMSDDDLRKALGLP